MNSYTVGAITVNGTTISQIVTSSLDPRIETFMNRAGGSPDVTFAAGSNIIPIASITSNALKAVMDLMGFGVLAVGTTVDLYSSKLAHGASRAAGSSHVKLTINDGLIVPRVYQAQQGQEATAQFDVIATYDGSNLPFTYGVAALPGSSLQATQKFTLGPVKIGSLFEAQSATINTGITEYVQGHSGEPYARLAAMQDRQVDFVISTFDLAMINTIGVEGGAISSPTVWFRKKDASEVANVADGTNEHISMVIPTAMGIPGAVNSPQSGESTFEFTMTAIDDGTNAPVTLDTTAVIA